MKKRHKYNNEDRAVGEYTPTFSNFSQVIHGPPIPVFEASSSPALPEEFRKNILPEVPFNQDCGRATQEGISTTPQKTAKPVNRSIEITTIIGGQGAHVRTREKHCRSEPDDDLQ
mmetsp:Transcript_689/g.1232  ORF Transcript_689/g.1232 Transcript_689/m.1232 type:complete len:115 (-) Transcript_689:650-994(-)